MKAAVKRLTSALIHQSDDTALLAPPTPSPMPPKRVTRGAYQSRQKGSKGLLVFKTVEDTHTHKDAHRVLKHINERDRMFSLGQE